MRVFTREQSGIFFLVVAPFSGCPHACAVLDSTVNIPTDLPESAKKTPVRHTESVNGSFPAPLCGWMCHVGEAIPRKASISRVCRPDHSKVIGEKFL